RAESVVRIATTTLHRSRTSYCAPRLVVLRFLFLAARSGSSVSSFPTLLSYRRSDRTHSRSLDQDGHQSIVGIGICADPDLFAVCERNHLKIDRVVLAAVQAVVNRLTQSF